MFNLLPFILETEIGEFPFFFPFKITQVNELIIKIVYELMV